MTDINPQQIYEKLVREGEAWADANYSAELLEETRKTLLAQLGGESNESSAAAKEAYALKHPDYRKHIETQVGARRAANKAKVRYDSAKAWVELQRTVSANERAATRIAP